MLYSPSVHDLCCGLGLYSQSDDEVEVVQRRTGITRHLQGHPCSFESCTEHPIYEYTMSVVDSLSIRVASWQAASFAMPCSEMAPVSWHGCMTGLELHHGRVITTYVTDLNPRARKIGCRGNVSEQPLLLLTGLIASQSVPP